MNPQSEWKVSNTFLQGQMQQQVTKNTTKEWRGKESALGAHCTAGKVKAFQVVLTDAENKTDHGWCEKQTSNVFTKAGNGKKMPGLF